jgi:hypothetical protein
VWALKPQNTPVKQKPQKAFIQAPETLYTFLQKVFFIPELGAVMELHT